MGGPDARKYKLEAGENVDEMNDFGAFGVK
jgi:hypothetical protein